MNGGWIQAIFFGALLVAGRIGAQVCPEATAKDCNRNGQPDSYDLNPTFTFEDPIVVDVGGDPGKIVAVDLDSDLLPDLIALLPAMKAISITRGTSDWLFPPAAVSLPAGGDPLCLAAGDLDGDGVLDLAVGVKDGDAAWHIAIFRNRGDGTFPEPDRIPLDSIPSFILAADLDPDGLADLTLSQNGISVFRNRGGAAFDPPQEIEAGSSPQGLVATDLNEDGRLELIAANEGSGDVTVHLNRGDGTFEANTSYPVGTGPHSVAAADFDGDRLIDLAVACSGSGEIMILRNDGRGRFQKAETVLPGGMPQLLAALDIEGDGDMDLITTVLDSSSSVVVLRNDGKGGFPEAVKAYQKGSSLKDLVVADMNGDSRPDFAVSSWNFDPPISSGVGIFLNVPPWLLGRDCNSNCIPDECELDCNGNLIADECELRDGQTPDCNRNGIPDDCEPDCDGNGVPDACEVDLDGNGVADVCEILGGTASDCNGNWIPDAIEIARGEAQDCNENGIADECDLVLRPGFPGPPGWIDLPVLGIPQYLAAGDLDGDGFLDLVVPVSTEGDGAGSLGYFFNLGKGIFRARTMDLAIRLAGSQVALGDLDGDGGLDIAVTGRTDQDSSVVQILINNTDGSFTKAGALPVAGSLGAIATADLDGDGRTDLCVGTFTEAGASGAIRLFMSRGGGWFEEMASIPLSGIPRSIAAGDLDGDRAVDLAVARKWVSKDSPGGVAVLCSRGGSSFDPPVELPDDPGTSDPWSLTLADLEGDGDMDLAVVDESRGRARVFLNRSGRTLARAPDIIIGNEPQSIAAGDLDGDGRFDLMAGAGAWGNVRTFLAKGGAFAAGPAFPAGGKVPFRSIGIADFDGDGNADVSFVSAGRIRILFNGGGGVFADTGQVTPSSRSPLVAADLDSDGLLDIAAGSGDHVTVLWNGGGRRLGPKTEIPCPAKEPSLCAGEYALLVPGDFDDDGLSDLFAFSGCECMPIYHDVPRQFSTAPSFQAIATDRGCDSVKDYIFAARAEDIDGDGDLDLSMGSLWHIWDVPNLGNGIFSSPTYRGSEDLWTNREDHLKVPFRGSYQAIGDLNGDGSLEITVGCCKGVYMIVSRTPINRSVLLDTPLLGCVQDMALGDLNEDGNLDMVLAEQKAEGFLDWRLRILLNKDGMKFTDGGLFPIPGPFTAPEIGDLDGDGDLDLAILFPYGFGILVNNGQEIFEPEYHIAPFKPTGMALGDLDGDGDRDIALRGSDPDGQEIISVFWNDPRPRSPDLNRDSVPDECQIPAEAKFRRGDANADGSLDLTDPVFLLTHLFLGGKIPDCRDAADANDDGEMDIADAVYSLNFQFLGGEAPQTPFLSCGLDPTSDGLSCEKFDSCR